MDPNKQYTQNELPSDIFNVGVSGEVRNFNGQQVKVFVNPNGTRSLQAASSPDSGGGGGGAGGSLVFSQPTLDLPKLYDSLYSSSGIKEAESGITASTQKYNDAVAKIKDNPYLSEANMTGRLSKINDKFTADNTNARNDIATKKADLETKLNIQTKQFDINSQQARTAFDQFQSLLSSGSLDNASPDDIANITRATGLSSSMIQSAIGASRAKNAPKLNTQVIQVDDGKNIKAVVIDQNTGKIINSQVIGDSKPTKGAAPKEISIDSKANQLMESNKNSYGHVSPTVWNQILSAYITDGGTKSNFVKLYGSYADPNRGDFTKAYGFSKP
jgi:hypothetical protein